MHLEFATKQFEGQIHELFCLPQVYEYLADGEAPPREVALDWVASAPTDTEHFGGGLWVLMDGNASTAGGLVRLAGDDNDELELTYIVHPNLWGIGLATRIAHTAMAHAFNTSLTNTVWAGADEPNKASIAVMKKLGMHFRRTVAYPMGSGVEYEMKKEDFTPNKISLIPVK